MDLSYLKHRITMFRLGDKVHVKPNDNKIPCPHCAKKKLNAVEQFKCGRKAKLKKELK